MPCILYEQPSKFTKVCVWKIAEDENTLRQSIELSEESELKMVGGHRSQQHLACLLALKEILKETPVIAYHENGKPYLKNHPNLFISFSHTRGYSAAMLSNHPVGVDIELVSDRIMPLQERFLCEQEKKHLSRPTPTILHIYWGLKEAAMKLLGNTKLLMTSDIRVQAFRLENGTTSVFVNNDYTLNGTFRKIEACVLTTVE